ncbi:hypothetical protein Tsubulata_015922 [Turnera subulata]|uniref:Mitochondrial glycoprotein n=1 Tax=Turnera subulata TaxID=218843 RepID=A0A9Q0FQK0_9ROSI|nr:hypothetical protein Tsubulata_015922 [Turnera subulata]
MPRVTPILRRGSKAVEDLNLLKVLQSEINHELSIPSQDSASGAIEGFEVDWDSSEAQDVVLRRKCMSGEEVAVSALLGPETSTEGSAFPRQVLMKVCVKKPGLSSVLQFDCGVYGKGTSSSQFDILHAWYLHSATSPNTAAYRGPEFRTLDPHLQEALKEYLEARGISESFMNSLLLYLHRKEQGQYVNWLQKLESLVGKDQTCGTSDPNGF